MILAADGKPYTEAEVNPPKHRDPCPACGSLADRLVVTGFGRNWRIVCHCGWEYSHGRGAVPDRTED